jgi:hypothetical protein
MKNTYRLSDSGYAVADDYRNGLWPDLAGKPQKDIWNFLVDEVRRRCPGFSEKEYHDALERGFVASR